MFLILPFAQKATEEKTTTGFLPFGSSTHSHQVKVIVRASGHLCASDCSRAHKCSQPTRWTHTVKVQHHELLCGETGLKYSNDFRNSLFSLFQLHSQIPFNEMFGWETMKMQNSVCSPLFKHGPTRNLNTANSGKRHTHSVPYSTHRKQQNKNKTCKKGCSLGRSLSVTPYPKHWILHKSSCDTASKIHHFI